MRKSIDSHIKTYEGLNDIPWGTINWELIASFHKKRDQMTNSELVQVWRYVQQKYPISHEQRD